MTRRTASCATRSTTTCRTRIGIRCGRDFRHPPRRRRRPHRYLLACVPVRVDWPLSLGAEEVSVPGLFSARINRQYVRKFDHDEARRRHAAGETMAALAREYRCSANWMRAIIRPEVAAKLAATSAAFMKSGVCVDCGTQITMYNKRCHGCNSAAAVTTVRDDELRCVTCQEWKPDTAYPKNVTEPHRRGRHNTCTACQTRQRRDYRHRHREQENAYSREYQRRRRMSA